MENKISTDDKYRNNVVKFTSKSELYEATYTEMCEAAVAWQKNQTDENMSDLEQKKSKFKKLAGL